MNCENCGNEIEDFAICSNCEIELRGAKMYVYIKSEKTLWTVGFYSPDGEWNPESDFDNSNDAADRVAYLNGSNKSKISEAEYNLKLALEEIEELKQAAERTPVELAAEDLLKVCENVLIGIISVRHEDYPKYQKEAYLRSLEGQLKQVLAKIRDNQLCRKNPSGPDECKSVQ